MPTNNEIDDLNIVNSNSDYFWNPESIFRDDAELDCLYDETFHHNLADFDMPLSFDNSTDILLQDATADQIIYEATKNGCNTNNNNSWSVPGTTLNISPRIDTRNSNYDVKLEALSSFSSSSDEELNSSHSPTPSSNSSSTEDSFLNTSPSNYVQYNNMVQIQKTNPVLNGNMMFILNPLQPNNKKIPIIKPKMTNKLPISKNVKIKTNKTSIIFPKEPTIIETSSGPPLNINDIYQSNDLKAFKKQQRMIKNREAASISRKRKKDYVTSLEIQLENLAKENNHLKQENTLLRQQLCAIQTQNNNNPTRKNTAILLAVLLTVSINIIPIKNIFTDQNMKETNTNQLISNDFHSRHLLSIEPDLPISDNVTVITKCPHQNETENVRLESDLRKIMATDQKLRKKYDVKRSTGLFGDLLYGKRIPFKLQRKLYRNNYEDLQMYYSYQLMNEYMEIFDSMHLKDDTFYVVSLKPDNNMLISAASRNQTSRPKMALLMPTVNDSMGHKNDSAKNDRITWMKIDCEVTNTNILHIKEKSVPKRLRNRVFPNGTTTEPQALKNAYAYNRSLTPQRLAPRLFKDWPKNASLPKKNNQLNYKPYFIKDLPDLSNNYDLKMKNLRFL